MGKPFMLFTCSHLSGRRMIAQGTNGCLWGSLMEGVMAGQDMLTFIYLLRTAVELYPPPC
jgi:hypothetical protein